MELKHSEGRSPFVADQSSGDEADGDYFVDCPVEGCDERVALDEIETHVGVHAAEDEGMAGAPHSRSDHLATPSSSHWPLPHPVDDRGQPREAKCRPEKSSKKDATVTRELKARLGVRIHIRSRTRQAELITSTEI
jgi:zinc finger-containing ubiquitin peptidase 1